MFERFTQGARLALFHARAQAERLGSERIETEHLLLGLLADESLSAHLLEPLSPKEVSSQLEQDLPHTFELLPGTDVPLSEESKSALRRAAEEADRLEDKDIGNEHILLGLLLEEKCRAAQLLARNGVTMAVVRTRVASLRQDPTLAASLREGSKALSPDWAELGIPQGYANPKLVFNPPSGALIVQVRSDSEPLRRYRLLIKRRSAAKYELLDDPDESTTYESPVTSLKQPLLAFNVTTWKKYGEHIGGDWKELRVIDLETRALEHGAKKGELILPEGFNDCWISDLLAMSDDGTQVYVTAGLCWREGADQSRITYVVASLDVHTKRLATITALRGVFF